MEEIILSRIQRINELANEDAHYRRLMKYMKLEEERVALLEQELNSVQADILWDFWGMSTEIENRKLYLACKYMIFPEETK